VSKLVVAVTNYSKDKTSLLFRLHLAKVDCRLGHCWIWPEYTVLWRISDAKRYKFSIFLLF